MINAYLEQMKLRSDKQWGMEEKNLSEWRQLFARPAVTLSEKKSEGFMSRRADA